MTNAVFVLGSTIADAVSLANATFSQTDYISDLRMSVCNANGQTTGSSIMVGLIKNNGHFAGFKGHKGVTVVGSFGAGSAELTTNIQAASANSIIYDLNLGTLGSNALGSVVYFGMFLQKTNMEN